MLGTHGCPSLSPLTSSFQGVVSGGCLSTHEGFSLSRYVDHSGPPSSLVVSFNVVVVSTFPVD